MLMALMMQSDSGDFLAGNAKFLRRINTGTILRIIRERQPISRVQIARLTGLTKSTVSSIIAELLDDDLIFETPSEERPIGRNPLNLSLRLGKHFVGAIDVDYPISSVGVVDIDGRVKAMSTKPMTRGRPEESIAMCVEELRALCGTLKVQHLEGVGLSLPGIVDQKKQILEFASSLQWKDFDLGDELRKLAPDFDKMSFGNSANLSALAELWFGTQEVDLTNFVFLSVHPGIGSGIIIEKRLLEGEYQASGEFGHTVIYDGGETCLCGSKGCLEAYASNWATVRRYASKKHRNAEDYAMQEIIDFAKKGDDTAIEVLKQTGYYLGVGISNIIKAIDPHAIIVGGEITQSWDLVYPEIMTVVGQRAYFGRAKHVEILPTSLTDPRLLGAATLAIERMFSDYNISD